MDNFKLQEAQPMELESQAVVYLNETRKWTLFLAIVGFIGMALMLLAGIFYTFVMSVAHAPLPVKMVTGIMMLVMAIVYFFPVLYLYKFSVISKQAILGNSQQDLTIAFRYLNLFFRYWGIVTIVMLLLYVLIFIVGFIVGFAHAF